MPSRRRSCRTGNFSKKCAFFSIDDATQALPLAADATKVRRPDHKNSTVKHEQPWDASSAPRSSWQAVGQPDAPTWKLVTFCFHHSLVQFLLTQNWSLPFLNVWNCCIPKREILSGYEEDVPFYPRPFYCVGDGTTCGRCSKSPRRILKHLSEGTTYLLKSIASTTTCPTVYLYKNG